MILGVSDRTVSTTASSKTAGSSVSDGRDFETAMIEAEEDAAQTDAGAAEEDVVEVDNAQADVAQVEPELEQLTPSVKPAAETIDLGSIEMADATLPGQNEAIGDAADTAGTTTSAITGDKAQSSGKEFAFEHVERASQAEPIKAGESASTELPDVQQDLDPAAFETIDTLKAEVTLHISRDLRSEALQDLALNKYRGVQPQEIARQIADKLMAADQNRIEITLTPEELGKIRLVITPGDTPTVSVYSDNRDTLDLLRRNSDLLQKELRDTGFGGASLSFGEEGGQHPPSAYTKHLLGDETDARPVAGQIPMTRSPLDRRLDIRI